MTFPLPSPPHGEMAEKVMLMILSWIYSNFDPLLNAVSYSDCLELQSNLVYVRRMQSTLPCLQSLEWMSL